MKISVIDPQVGENIARRGFGETKVNFIGDESLQVLSVGDSLFDSYEGIKFDHIEGDLVELNESLTELSSSISVPVFYIYLADTNNINPNFSEPEEKYPEEFNFQPGFIFEGGSTNFVYSADMGRIVRTISSARSYHQDMLGESGMTSRTGWFYGGFYSFSETEESDIRVGVTISRPWSSNPKQQDFYMVPLELRKVYGNPNGVLFEKFRIQAADNGSRSSDEIMYSDYVLDKVTDVGYCIPEEGGKVNYFKLEKK